jgi:hypothetical protein
MDSLSSRKRALRPMIHEQFDLNQSARSPIQPSFAIVAQRTARIVEDRKMQLSPPPRRCPVCGVAMIAEKSQPHLGTHDRYVCLNCGTTIAIEQPPDGQGPTRTARR